MTIRYVADPWVGRRRRTRVVQVGDVGIGGDHPIRLQSMTNTDTLDTKATVDQIERLVAAGCEIARVTAPSIREAENLREIAGELRRRGVRVPLVADIHFTPNAAMIAALHVEKVRINPGNYADKKKFEVREYGEAEYRAELERVAERFRPLVRRCKERGVAMRIGTNHGSLSDRIMNRFGDSPLGMVESALEFLDVCEDEGFRDVVFSMKASNTQVAIQAYRLLAGRLEGRAPDEPGYPFHVGVTEAGDAEDGRIKSAIGIGSLLEDGIGDTIRVSLTEDPVKEIPVARALARRAEARWAADAGSPRVPGLGADFVRDPYRHARRSTRECRAGGLWLGGEQAVRVELDLGAVASDPATAAPRVAVSLAGLRDVVCEGLAVTARDAAEAARLPTLSRCLAEVGVELPVSLELPAGQVGSARDLPPGIARLCVRSGARDTETDLARAAAVARAAGVALEWRLEASCPDLPGLVDRALAAGPPGDLAELLFSVESPRASHASRILAARLSERGAADLPIVLRHRHRDDADAETAILEAAIDLGTPLCDGIGDAVSLAGFAEPARAVDLAYRVLQGARLRTTRTEYISCPSCGRTLFDLEETTARIKARTRHLQGVKIAVMGCIVNGPGEMADADFGYVGSGVGKVTLYVGREVVARNLGEAEAPDRLVDLIRAHGRWQEPRES